MLAAVCAVTHKMTKAVISVLAEHVTLWAVVVLGASKSVGIFQLRGVVGVTVGVPRLAGRHSAGQHCHTGDHGDLVV